jgi:hypothetical protein
MRTGEAIKEIGEEITNTSIKVGFQLQRLTRGSPLKRIGIPSGRRAVSVSRDVLFHAPMRELPFSTLSIQPLLQIIEESFPNPVLTSSTKIPSTILASSSTTPSPSLVIPPSRNICQKHHLSLLSPNNSSFTHPSCTISSHTTPSPSLAFSSSSTLTSSSVIAMIIECSKIEIKKSKKGKDYESLSLYISDPSYHLFKLNYYGTDALHLLSHISVGDILLINNFNIKLQSTSHAIYFGVAEYQTKTFILRYATGEYQFNTKLYPKIYSMVQTLVHWAKRNFPLHLANLNSDHSSNPPHISISIPESLHEIPTTALWIDIVLRYQHAVMSSGDPNQFQKHWVLTDRSNLQVLLKFPSYQEASIAATDLHRSHVITSPSSPPLLIICKNVLVVRDRSRSSIR